VTSGVLHQSSLLQLGQTAAEVDKRLVTQAHKMVVQAGVMFCALFVFLPTSNGAAVRIRWDRSESTDVFSYRVYHSANLTGSLPTKWELVGSTINLTFLHTNLALGTHRWFVTAVAFGVESEPSPEVSLTITKPSPPLQVGARMAGTNVSALFRSTDLVKWEKLCQWDEPADEMSFFRIELQELQDETKRLPPVTQSSTSRSRLPKGHRFP
jgi:hypothetical protein